MNSGSHWHRWDPHIHAPGTHLNDQFAGADVWNQYLTKIEQASPVISALGVTDYCALATYEKVVAEKAKGRLPQVRLVFANVEMRLAIGTQRGGYVNIHLLICPDDPTHLDEARRFLGRLKFKVDGDTFACTDSDLTKLGKHTDSSLSDVAAIRKGVEQFKVELTNLRDEFKGSEWAQRNILIGVAGAQTDGSSGVRDAADTALRVEIEKFAHVIFASSDAQRAFWLGDGPAAVHELEQKYGGQKPCIHGCDAHDLVKVGAPDGDRYTWVKGLIAFDTLRQALSDPRGRAFVGPQPPIGTIASQALSSVEITGAAWAQTPSVALNPGMVAIIGARGSGKSALAEMIALGCDSIPEHQNDNSFLRRAAELLAGVTAKVVWQSGEPSDRSPQDGHVGGADRYPRARYLSQQFVEELCAADRVTDGLINEVQRVIYEAHPLTDRDGTSNFEELLELRVAVLRQGRLSQEAALSDLSERIGTDKEKHTQVAAVKGQIEAKEKLIEGYKADRTKLVSKGSEARVARLEALMQAAQKVRGYLRYFANQKQSLESLDQEVRDHRTQRAPEALRQSKVRYQPSGIKEKEWERFLLEYKGDVDAAITAHKSENERRSKEWKGTPPPETSDPTVAIVGDEADLDKQPLALLEAEILRLQKAINVDKDTANKYAAISKRVDEETAAIVKLQERLGDCEGAAGRIKQAQADRESAYKGVFDSIAKEQGVLNDLYAPLRTRLGAATGATAKLTLSVVRKIDLAAWASQGEGLLDLRKATPFQGRGKLRRLAEEMLEPAWRAGDAVAVGKAMTEFQSAHVKDLPAVSAIPPTEQANYRDWLQRFAKWLYSTDHISLQYSIDYDGVDIRKLSPGTRGIVLLLLYLALDDSDDRPLIVDQPEENLDPKSIYEELVPLFRAAKAKRQVVLVTHNANLVVNTDADQVIVASAGAHAPGQLPPISYTSGGLEEAGIRKLVCDILEGGEAAFRERARRLRVRIDR